MRSSSRARAVMGTRFASRLHAISRSMWSHSVRPISSPSPVCSRDAQGRVTLCRRCLRIFGGTRSSAATGLGSLTRGDEQDLIKSGQIPGLQLWFDPAQLMTAKPAPPTAATITTTQGGAFQAISNTKQASARTKSCRFATELVNTGE